MGELVTLDSVGRSRAKKLGGKPTLPRDQADRVRQFLVELRKRFDSDSQMAAALDVSQPTVSDWMAGRSSPGIEALDAIAKHFGITEHEMRTGIMAAEQATLEVAIRYHGRDAWPEHAIRRARQEQAQGVRMSAQKWAERLTTLARGNSER